MELALVAWSVGVTGNRILHLLQFPGLALALIYCVQLAQIVASHLFSGSRWQGKGM